MPETLPRPLTAPEGDAAAPAPADDALLDEYRQQDAELAQQPAGGEEGDALLDEYRQQDAELVDAETQRLGRLGFLLGEAKKAGGDRAAIAALATQTGQDIDKVERNYDAIKAAVDADAIDARAFSEAQPVVAQLLLEEPQRAQVVAKDEQVTGLTKALRWIGNAYASAEAMGEASERLRFGDRAGAEAAMLESGKHTLRNLEPPKKVEYVEDEAAKATGLTRLPTIFSAAVAHNSKQVKFSALAANLLQQELRGEDSWETEKQLVDLERDLAPRSYGEGPLELYVTGVAELVPTQGVSLGGAALGLAVGATVGAITRQPGAALRYGKMAAKVGGFGASVVQESAVYWDFRRARTDSGELVSRRVAQGGAIGYSLLSSAVGVFSLTEQLKAAGPLGAAIATGKAEGKEAFLRAMKDATFRKKLEDLAKAWGKGSFAEATEEGVQTVLEGIAGWGVRSVQAGSAQKLDTDALRAQALDAASKGALGGGAMTTAMAMPQVALEVTAGLREAATQRGAHRAKALAENSSPNLKAVPDIGAELVRRETAATGTEVKSVFVDAKALTRFFQESGDEDAAASATALLGEDGPRLLQEALETGDNLEVPLEDFIARFGGTPAAAALAGGDMTTEVGAPTLNQAAAREAEAEAATQQLAQETEGEAAPQVVSEAERRLVDAAQVELQRAGYVEADAEALTSPMRQFIRTMAARMGRDADALFNWTTDTMTRKARDAQAQAAQAQALAEGRPVQLHVDVDGNTTYQQAEGASAQVKRGDVAFWVDETGRRRASITLNPEANLSTFLHETGHVWLEMFGDLVEREDAPQQVKEDWALLLKHIGAEKREDIATEHHEVFARSAESFFREGKAPSPALTRAFRRFYRWLTGIYRSAPPQQLSEEVRGVFRRMMATDEEIARQSGAATPLFTTREAAGMSATEWAAYQAALQKAEAQTQEAAQRRVAEDAAREDEAWWKDEVAKRREGALAEYDAKPEARAREYLQHGTMSAVDEDGTVRTAQGTPQPLSEEAVRTLLGEVPASLAGLVQPEGAHPDAVAALFGLPTGKALLEALQALPPRETWAQARAEESMREAHPDALADREKLAEVVQHQLHEAPSTDVLLRELYALGRRAGLKAPPREAFAAAARRMVDAREVRALDAPGAQRAEAQAAQRARTAIARGDTAAAFEGKKQQLLNHHLYRAIEESKRGALAFVATARGLTTQAQRKRLGLGGRVYLSFADTVLTQLGLRLPEGAAPALPRGGLEGLVAKLAADGYPVPAFDVQQLAPLLATARPWRALTVGELRNVHAALQQTQQAALEAGHLRSGAQLAEVVQGVAQDASRLKDRGVEPVSEAGQPSAFSPMDWLHGGHVARRNPDRLLRKLGPTATRVLWDGYIEARNRKQEIAGRVLDAFVTLWGNLPEEMQARRYEAVDASALPIDEDLALVVPWDRQTVWMLATHVGNDVAFQRLVDGFGWTRQQVLSFLNATLTREEWGFVQGLWDLNEKHLYPLEADAYERANGLRPQKPQALPIVTPHGTFRGGHVPARYVKTGKALQAEEESTTAANVAKGLTAPPQGEYVEVPDLAWGAMVGRLLETVHYAAFDSYTRDATRVLKHPTVQATIGRRMGKVYREALNNWLEVATETAASGVDKEMAVLHKMLSLGKTAVGIKALGWNPANAAGDFGNPFTAAVAGKVSVHRMAIAYAQAFGGRLAGKPALFAMREEALKNSPELRLREDSSLGRLQKKLETVGNRGRRNKLQVARDAVADTAFFFQALVAKLTEPVIWHAAKWDALAKGKTLEEAYAYADDRLRQSTPAKEKAEQPAILRDKQAAAILVFHGFGNHIYNLNADLVSAFQEKWGGLTPGWKAGGSALLAGHILAVLWVAGAAGSLLSFKAPKKDEETWLEFNLLQTASMAWGQFPILGPILQFLTEVLAAKAGDKKRPMRFSARSAPGLAGGQAIVETVTKVFSEEGDTADKALDYFELALMGALLPSGAPVRAARYVEKVATGEHQPEDWYEPARGIVGAVRVDRGQ